jgi:DNA-3-methyladenine glycosylase I
MKQKKKIPLSKKRCDWCLSSPLYIQYHDEEWGVPVHSDRKHFEFLILEGAQAGLSWATILKRRAGYKKAFANFDPKKVARFTKRDVSRLLKDEGIIRNRLKIQSAIKNAELFLNLQKEFGSFDTYLWGFTKGKTVFGKRKTLKDIPARTELSDRVSADLKKRGFSFVGSTIMYAHLQAVGIVNDHVSYCFKYKK